MALFSLVFFVVVLVLIGVGIAFGLVLAGVTAVLVSLGIVSSSVTVAIRKKSAQAGLRLFLFQSGLLAGIPAGVLCAWFVAQFSELYQLDPRIFIYGGIGGAVGGLLVALMLHFILRQTARAGVHFLRSAQETSRPRLE